MSPQKPDSLFRFISSSYIVNWKDGASLENKGQKDI
jgi:hypothetical protein